MAFGRSPIWIAGAADSLPGAATNDAVRRSVQRHSQRAEGYGRSLGREVCALDGDGRPAFYDLMKRQCKRHENKSYSADLVLSVELRDRVWFTLVFATKAKSIFVADIGELEIV